MEFHLLTIFPKILDSYTKESLFKRAIEKKIVKITSHNLRDFASGIHRKVDDKPFGGGPGMVMQLIPIYKAVEAITKKSKKKKTRVVLLSPRGKPLDSKMAKRLATYDSLICIAGRYEGVDERIAEHVADEVISIGDYVLSGGELAALVLMESVSRFIPGFLGKQESLEDTRGSFPAYSRPESFSPKKGKSWKVPKVLLSGNHAAISAWRETHKHKM